MSRTENENTYRHALQSMEITALNFGYRFIKDSRVRQEYIRRIQAMSSELKSAVQAGTKSPLEAAKVATEMRNEIMEMSRIKSSDIGLAKAKSLKIKGITFDNLVKKYAKDKFSTSFEKLTKGQQDEVLIEIVEASGRANPKMSVKAGRLGAVGRGLWVISIAVAAYNIGSAEDKVDATQREVVGFSGGFAGGAAGGAAAGIWFGPIGIAVGVAVGGVLGAVMADQAYVQIRGQKDVTVGSIISRYTGFFSTDEEGIVNALYNEAGIEMRLVSQVFTALSRDYSTDSDDVASLYVDRIKRDGGAKEHALRLNKALRGQLIAILESGWTSGVENRQIQYLRSL